MPLNYYAINSILSARMKTGRRPQFGGFGVLGAVGEVLKGKDDLTPSAVVFSPNLDRRIAEAFETVREGRAPDAILWDSELASAFYRECKANGVHAPSSELGRRLISIRKSPKYYSKRLVKLEPTRVTEPTPSIVWSFAHAVEYGLVTLRYTYGVSIDDILLDPKMAREFDRIAQAAAPTLTSRQVRLAALYIRKTRHLAAKERTLFDQLDPSDVEREMAPLGSLSLLSLSDVPATDGIFQISEKRRCLFVGRTPNLQEGLSSFVASVQSDAMSNPFWSPEPDRIFARVFVGKSFQGLGTSKWQLGLIQSRIPVFNWPVHNHRAA